VLSLRYRVSLIRLINYYINKASVQNVSIVADSDIPDGITNISSKYFHVLFRCN